MKRNKITYNKKNKWICTIDLQKETINLCMPNKKKTMSLEEILSLHFALLDFLDFTRAGFEGFIKSFREKHD